MDKYKSLIVPEKDINVYTHRRWFDEEQTDNVFVVEIKHIPSGIIFSSENKNTLYFGGFRWQARKKITLAWEGF